MKIIQADFTENDIYENIEENLQGLEIGILGKLTKNRKMKLPEIKLVQRDVPFYELVKCNHFLKNIKTLVRFFKSHPSIKATSDKCIRI